MRKWRDRNDTAGGGNEVIQTLVPHCLRSQLLNLAHDASTSGHLGMAKTQSRLLQHFYWPNLFKDVKEYCRTCDTCQRIGKNNRKPKAPLITPPIISESFKRISIDIVGPLKPTSKGCRFILTVIDHATRWLHAFPLVRHTAADIADAMMSYFTLYGFPSELLSDLGSDFMSELFQVFLHKFDIKQLRCTSSHPQCNGIIERMHSTLKRMLKSSVNDYDGNWDDVLGHVLFALRTSPVASLGFTPYELLFGKQARTPLTLIYESWHDVNNYSENVVNHIMKLRDNISNAFDLAKQQQELTHAKEKLWYDRNARAIIYVPGQQVLVLLPVLGQPLAVKYQGPFTIVKQTSEVDYLVHLPGKRKEHKIVHTNMLKPYNQRVQFVNKAIEPLITHTDALVTTVEIDTDILSDELNETDIPPLGGREHESDKATVHDLSHLTDDKRAQIKDILDQYSDLFCDTPGRTSVVKHSITLKENVAPIRKRPYRMNPKQQDLLRKEINQMLHDNIIRETESEWASPVILVNRENKVRCCVDYRDLNSISICPVSILPRVDDLIDRIGRAQYLSKIDCSKGFWQIPLDKHAQEVSAFVTPFGHYAFNFMPFGLKESPNTFEKAMCKTLQGCESFAGIYLDDIVIASNTWEEHLMHVSLVLEKLKLAGFTLKACKCMFGCKELDFLGHRLGHGLVQPGRAKIEALLACNRPLNRKQLHSFVGLAGYYSKFIPHYSHLICPLTNLLSPRNPFVWSNEAEKSFQLIKVKLASPPVLLVPDFNKPFSLFVDCSDIAMGACLTQKDEQGLDHPISFMSKKLNKAQKNYSTTEKEALALLTAVRAYRVYLTGSVIVYTDHSPLAFLKRMAGVNQKLLRWSLELDQFDINIQHIRGRENLIADYLSRPSS